MSLCAYTQVPKSADNGGTGIVVRGAGTKIYHNTVYGNKTGLEVKGTKNVEIKNNLVIGGSSGLGGLVAKKPEEGTQSGDGGVQRSGRGSRTSGRGSRTSSRGAASAATNTEPVVADNLTEGDPMFVDPEKGDFRLKEWSPAAGFGAILEVGTDGVARPRAPESWAKRPEFQVGAFLADDPTEKKSDMRTVSLSVIGLSRCHYNIFDGLTLEYGVRGFNTHHTTRNITVRNCVIRSIASQGIISIPEHCVIENCLFQKIGSSKFQHAMYGNLTGVVVRHNVFRKPRKMTVRSAPSGGVYYVEIIAWGQGGNRIYNNVFYGEGKRGGISLNSIDNRVYNNTFVGSTYAIGFHKGQPGNHAAAAPRWERDGVAYSTFAACDIGAYEFTVNTK